MLIFDTLEYAKELQAAGVSAQQAEVHARTLRSLVENDLVTKRDLKETEALLKRDIEEMEAKLTRDLKETEAKLTRDIEEMGMKLTIRLGGLLVLGITVVATLVKIL